jgi:hypothetical protein
MFLLILYISENINMDIIIIIFYYYYDELFLLLLIFKDIYL